MRTRCEVTRGTVSAQLLPLDYRGMTGMAIDRGVRTEQRKLCPGGVVIRNRLPAVVSVTVGARAAEASRMGIVGAMTAETVLRQLVLETAGAMTVAAVQLGVATGEGKPSLASMIELGGLPGLGRVAAAAL